VGSAALNDSHRPLSRPLAIAQGRVHHARVFARTLLLLVIATLAGAAARAEEPGQRLRGEAALREALADRTFYGRYVGGIDWIEYYAPDGRSAYWDGCTHDGDWWIADDLICFRYRGDAAGANYCWMMFRVGEGYEFVMPDDGAGDPARAYTTDIREGNREHLPLDTDDCVSARLDAPAPQ
jgi:hypothetical protein